MDYTKTLVILDRKLWKKFKETARNKGLLLMPLLEEVLKSYLKKDGKVKWIKSFLRFKMK